jgi:hypothetical protein
MLYEQYITPQQGGVTSIIEKKALPAPAGKEVEIRKKPEKRGMKRRWGIFSETIPLTPTPANPDPSVLNSGSNDQVNGNSSNGHGNIQNGTSTASPPNSDELPVTNGMKQAEVVEPDLLFSAEERHILQRCAKRMSLFITACFLQLEHSHSG